MRAAAIAAGALALASALAPPAAAQEPVRVYGVELQAGADRDRVLVLAERPLEAELSSPEPSSVLLRLPGATLEPSAARRILPTVGGAVTEVVSFVPLTSGAPEVRVQIRKRADVEATLSRRGSILAVELPLPAGARDVGITLRFVDSELADVVREVAQATGTSFLFDERLQGRVTISVVNRVSAAEAVEILQAALLSKGFAALPSPGGAFRILPAGDAKGVAPWTTAAPDAGREAPVTTLVRPRFATAGDLVAALERSAGAGIGAIAYAPSNSVILSGSEARLHRYLALLRALDEAEAEQLELVVLRHRAAAAIAGVLAEVAAPAARDGWRRASFEVWHDERTNALLLRGSAAKLAEIRAWLAELDVAEAGEGALRVIRPLHADATRLAETLQQLAAGGAPAAGQPSPAALGLAGRSFSVAVHESTGSLIVHADPETQRIVREVVEQIDRLPPTVLVELTVLEVTTSRTLALGFDAFLPFGDPDDPGDLVGAVSIQGRPGGVFAPVTEPGVLRYARAPLMVPIVGPGGVPTVVVVPREIVQITADEGNVTARTLLRPHLLALSGEEHELVAGLNVPVLTSATESAESQVTIDPLTIRNDIERRDVGMILRVKPTAGQAGDVRLELEVEASRVRELPGSVVNQVGPVLEQRKLSAVTRLEHGQVAVIGMSLEPVEVEREAGVPFLRDVPILGWLGRSTRSERMNRELVIAVQASIERSAAERVSDSIRRRLVFERSLARRGALSDAADAYAVLVTTRSSEAEARALAEALDAPAGRPARVVAWEFEGEPRFDVYLAGFATLPEAAAAVEPLVAAGWLPEVVALPPRELAREPAPAKPE
jgi:general secretion pathway protein D